MPGIILFNRVFALASDDFLIPSLYGISLHVGWLAFSTYLFIQEPTYQTCSDYSWIYYYLVISMGFQVANIILNIFLLKLTFSGTISNEKPRVLVGPLLSLITCIKVPELLLNLYALIQYFYSAGCVNSTAYLNLLLLCIGFILATLIAYFISIILAVLSSHPNGLILEDRPRHLQRALTPLFSLSLVPNRGSEYDVSASVTSILGEVAKLVMDLLGNGHLVASDVLTGMILVKRLQGKRSVAMNGLSIHQPSSSNPPRGTISQVIVYPHNAPTPDHDSMLENVARDVTPLRNAVTRYSSSIPLSSLNEPFHTDARMIERFVHYSASIYGFPLYMFSNFTPGLVHLCCPCTTPPPTSSLIATQLSMNEAWANHCLCCFPAAWFQKDPIHSDLIYTSIDGRLFKSPFVVMVDQITKSIVISIRGTMSAQDLLADLLIREQVLQWTENGEVKSTLTHRGIHQIAINILMEIKVKCVLNQLMEGECSGWRIVTTGHSLGAGVACLLAFIIKNDVDFVAFSNQVYAFCYSTPGMMISASGLDYFKTFCVTIVLGDDLVPSLSPRNVSKLKAQMTSALLNCHERKAVLLTSTLLSKLLKIPQMELDLEDGLLDVEEEYHGVDMYLPGHICHFIRDGEGWKANWENAQLFNSIKITWTMGVDHLPNRCVDVLTAFIN